MATLNLNDFDSKLIEGAKKWHKELLTIAVLSMKDSTKFLTPIAGIRTNQYLGAIGSDAQFSPYAANKRGDSTTSISYEELVMRFGCLNEDFVPNNYVQSLIAKQAIYQGDGMKNTPLEKLVLGAIMKSAGEYLALALANAEYDASGTTSMALFDGYATQVAAAVTAGKVSTAKGNLVELDEEITSANALDIVKDIIFNLPTQLRAQETLIYCAPDLVDKYNEAYQLAVGAVPYNQRYEQAYVEGSNRRTTFAPLPAFTGSPYMIVAPKSNLIYGYDTTADEAKFEVLRLNVDTLTAAAKIFFGVGFRTFDKRFFRAVKLHQD